MCEIIVSILHLVLLTLTMHETPSCMFTDFLKLKINHNGHDFIFTARAAFITHTAF